MTENKLEVIAPNGWRKEYVLQKPVIYIGSDPGNDIALGAADDPAIAPRHLQLITDPNEGYRLVNLGDSEVWLGSAGEKGIAPHVSTQLAGNEPIKVGEFVITLRGEMWAAGGPTNQSRNIGLNLSLPQTRLEPNQTLEGVLTLFNLGDHPGAQFELDLEGFDPDCYEIEPGPLLSSGADKEMFFWLYHLGQRPLAGDVNLTIRAAAPKAYPREHVTATRTITVMPFYQYAVRLFGPGSPQSDEATSPAKPMLAGKAAAESDRAPEKQPLQTAAPAQPEPDEPEPSQEDAADWWTPLPAAAAQPAETQPEQPEIEVIPPETEETAVSLSQPVQPATQPLADSDGSAEQPTAEPMGTDAADDTIVSVEPPPMPEVAPPPADKAGEESVPPTPPPAQPAETGAVERTPETMPAPSRFQKQPAQYREEISAPSTRRTPQATEPSSDLWTSHPDAETSDTAPRSELWSDSKQEREPSKLKAKKYKPPASQETEQEQDADSDQPPAGAGSASDTEEWWDDIS